MKINKFENWVNVENDWSGHYRLVVATKVAYEIFVEYYETSSDILTAKASLCITGMWQDKKDDKVINTVEREWLGKHLPIQKLLEIAQKDYEEMNG